VYLNEIERFENKSDFLISEAGNWLIFFLIKHGRLETRQEGMDVIQVHPKKIVFYPIGPKPIFSSWIVTICEAPKLSETYFLLIRLKLRKF